LCQKIPCSPKSPTGAGFLPMSIAKVRSLPLREKFQILEVIWEDLGARVDKMEISPAGKELMDSRIERVRNGEAEIHDWDTAKQTLGRR
jgi:hypothetical protein